MLLLLFTLSTASAEPPVDCSGLPTPVECVELGGAVAADPDLVDEPTADEADTEAVSLEPVVDEADPRTWREFVYDVPVDALFWIARGLVRPEHVDDGALMLLTLLCAGLFNEARRYIDRRHQHRLAALAQPEPEPARPYHQTAEELREVAAQQQRVITLLQTRLTLQAPIAEQLASEQAALRETLRGAGVDV